jgi:hypothetical protein
MPADARKRPIVRICILSMALTVSSNALALDENVSFCGLRGGNSSSSVVSVSVSMRDVASDSNRSLEATVISSDVDPPARGVLFHVGVGDPISFNGTVYRVDDLRFDAVERETSRRRSELSAPLEAIVIAGLRPKDCVTAHADPAFGSQKNLLVLQARPGSASFSNAPRDHAETVLFLDRITQSTRGDRVATLTWQSGPANSWRAPGNAPDLPVHRLSLKANDIFVLPGVGRLRAVQVNPKRSYQPAWLVLKIEDLGQNP